MSFGECKSKMGRFRKKALLSSFILRLFLSLFEGLTNFDMVCLALVRLRKYMTSNKAIRFHPWFSRMVSPI